MTDTPVREFTGEPVRRREDFRLITGNGRYIDDMTIAGCCAVVILRSPYAHARIKAIDVRRALSSPGVHAVLTGEDIARLSDPFPVGVANPPAYYAAAVDRVRFVGEPVAVVVATNRYLAEDALDTIEVTYEPLQVVTRPEEALRPGAPSLHDTHPDNVAWHRRYRYGDVDTDFNGSDLVVAETFRYPRYSSIPLETYGVVAQHDPTTSQYTVHCNFQGPFTLHPVMARALRVPDSQLRIVVPQDIGGSFGTKAMIYPYVVLVALAARAAGRPVKWIEDRLEHLRASSSGSDRLTHLEGAFSRDGILVALRAQIRDNVGAYLRAPEPASILRMLGNFGGPYRVRSLAVEALSVLTNTTPTGLNRGYGGQQHYFALERLLDLAANRLGLDPAEVRRRNFIGSAEFPYRTVSGGLYDSGDYPGAFEKLLALLPYDKCRAEQARARQEGRLIGIGLATAVDPSTSNMGYITLALPPEERAKPGYLPKSGSVETARVKMDPDGRVSVIIGTAGQGQGHETVAGQIVAGELGVAREEIRVVDTVDTAASPWSVSSGTYSSRFAAMGASAVGLAARRLKEKIVRIAAHLLEAPPGDVQLADGEIRVKGAPWRSVRLRRIAGMAHWNPESLPADVEPGLEATVTFQFPEFGPPDSGDRMNASGTYGFMADAVVVEVARDSGQVLVLEYASVHDAGRILNPLVVEGQRAGALVHGLGGALFEEFVYAGDGQHLSGTLADYLCPTTCEVPPVKLAHIETPSPFTLYGAKGCGDGSVVPASAAIANAVADALRPLGIPVTELPLTPVKIWTWLQKAPRHDARSV